MRYEMIHAQNHAAVLALLKARWYTTDMILRGERCDLSNAEGIVAIEDDAIAGLLTYRVEGGTCEILSLDSLAEGRGVGTELIRRAILLARENGCARLIAVTTNDNIEAMRFYQRRGFDMVLLSRDALDVSRKLKPEIPLFGMHGIPLKHEITFSLDLFAALPEAPPDPG